MNAQKPILKGANDRLIILNFLSLISRGLRSDPLPSLTSCDNPLKLANIAIAIVNEKENKLNLYAQSAVCWD